MPRALLDRDAELVALTRQLRAARAGGGRLIVVEGPAGIGKSSLLAVTAQSATAEGIVTLVARGGPLEQDAAWGIARRLFEPLRRDPAWSELTVGAAALAERALDAGSAEPARGGDAMHAAAHGLTWLASNLAERAPALLMIDDVHWVDAPSLGWLAKLARDLDGLALAIVCSVRSGEPPGQPELLAELLAAAPEPFVRPRALGPAAAEALVCERLPTADPSFAHACHAVTGGNPFLLRALIAQLLADEVQPSRAVAERLTSFGPEQVARSVERRLARLPDGAAQLTTALTVLGRGASLRLLARLARIEPKQAAQIADALRAAGLFDDGDEPAFAHPLVEAALSARLSAGRRALWHADAAELLTAERADPERIALHLLHAEPAGDDATVRTLQHAAARANARGAPQNAATLLARALAEPPADRALAADVGLELGVARIAALQPGGAELLHDAVACAASATQRSTIALRGGRALGLGGFFRDVVALCEHALADPGEAEPAALARLEAELAANAWLQAATITKAHARLREPVVERAELGLWRANAAMEAMLAGRPAEEPVALLRPLLRHEVFTREPDSLTGTIASFTLIHSDDLDGGRQRYETILEIARPRGWLIAIAHASILRAMALLRAGRVREAETDARLAFEYKQPVAPIATVLMTLYALVIARVELDELDGAEQALIAAGLGEPPSGEIPAALTLQSRARLRLAQRRPADAYADLLAAADSWRALGVTHPVLADWRLYAADALTQLDDPTAAHQLAREQVALAERLGTPGARGTALRALARTAPREERVTLLERSDRLLADSPARLERVRTLIDLGTALRHARRPRDARDTLRHALDLANAGGMRRLARHATTELQAAGARPRRDALTGPNSLTPAEHRVCTLAATGLSNREIAEELWITRRTVETHLTHAFQKLDITTRTQLPARLHADRLQEPIPA
jgi:DNA-binding NarL/FixJ family response regulator